MLDKRKVGKMVIICLLGSAVLNYPTTAQAWGIEKRGAPLPKAVAWGGGRHSAHPGPYNYHHRYPIGRSEVVLPRGFISIVFGKGHYFYGGGFFYRQEPQGYVVVPAPSGAVVYSIPPGYHQVIIDGVMYYTYEGVYYQRVSSGYKVVEPPTTVVVEPATVVANPPVDQSQKSFTVNIPNNKGGFTSVVLKKSGNGFLGPQGEFYAEFPKVEQLRVMYAE